MSCFVAMIILSLPSIDGDVLSGLTENGFLSHCSCIHHMHCCFSPFCPCVLLQSPVSVLLCPPQFVHLPHPHWHQFLVPSSHLIMGFHPPLLTSHPPSPGHSCEYGEYPHTHHPLCNSIALQTGNLAEVS